MCTCNIDQSEPANSISVIIFLWHKKEYKEAHYRKLLSLYMYFTLVPQCVTVEEKLSYHSEHDLSRVFEHPGFQVSPQPVSQTILQVSVE